MTANILVHGCRGRMGQMICRILESDPETEVGGAVDQGDDAAAALAGCRAAIDFSMPAPTVAFAALCADKGVPLVIGTTGLDPAQEDAVREAARRIPVVFAPNYSIGVNTLFWLTRKAAEILGEEFDLEVVEMHHRHKKDAPSGTARRLAEILAAARGLSYADDCRHGREGLVGARTDREIGVHAVRGGDVVGDHTVIFAADGERVELAHKASSRETFARGAVRAAKWAIDQPPGLYDMQAVLGFS
jgi:4-hydroxy-tetrahydrodipicolinate reductase